MNNIGNYVQHAKFWDWGGHDRSGEHEYWTNYATEYGKNILIPMCALGETGAYIAERGFTVTAFDFTPEMIEEGKKRFGNLKNLRFLEGDITNFQFDIEPADFCFCSDFGHIYDIENLKKALVCINNHLRDGGCLVIETDLPIKESNHTPLQTFYPVKQVYPNLKVWKTGETRNDAETGRYYISQTFYTEDENGNVESFDHSFYLQNYFHETWLTIIKECGFEIKHEYSSRDKEPWCEGGGQLIVEAVKSIPNYKKYIPQTNLHHLRTPIYKHENVGLYNDIINLQQPNDGYLESYRFDINADENWVGWIQVKIGYSLRAYYDGQIGYMINDESNRNKGYATNACLALKPFLAKLGYKYITLSTDENNIASRRVCEKIGAELLDIVDTPTWTGIYQQGQRRTCIYEWKIIEEENKDE